MNDDSNEVGCPSCGDDSDACRCFVVLSWEGFDLSQQWGDLEHSSLDRILHGCHGATLLRAPPSRGCRPLAGLPGRLAVAIEAYWLEASEAVELEDLRAFRKIFDEAEWMSRFKGDPDPSESRHPRHADHRAALREHSRRTFGVMTRFRMRGSRPTSLRTIRRYGHREHLAIGHVARSP